MILWLDNPDIFKQFLKTKEAIRAHIVTLKNGSHVYRLIKTNPWRQAITVLFHSAPGTLYEHE